MKTHGHNATISTRLYPLVPMKSISLKATFNPHIIQTNDRTYSTIGSCPEPFNRLECKDICYYQNRAN